MNHIELFAGCGGLSLGLKAAGFKLILANEKSPMAAETFSYNLLGYDQKKDNSKNILLNNPDEFRDFLEGIPTHNSKLHIGDIADLVNIGYKYSKLIEKYNFDLISGGPPCQGFSLAGRRKERNPKNNLPYSFLEFVHITDPKFVLLENVLGITQPFKKDGGVKYPWFELAKAFMSRKYIPFCFIVNARDFGVPQNRPRFILFAVRSDQKRMLKKIESLNDIYVNIIKYASEFLGRSENELSTIKLSSAKKDGYNLINLDKNNPIDYGFNIKNYGFQVSTSEAIDDLSKRSGVSKCSTYVKSINKLFSPYLVQPRKAKSNKIANFEKRNHSDRVKKRFTFLQVASIHNIHLDFSKLDNFFLDGALVKKYYEALHSEGLIKKKNSSQAKQVLESMLLPLRTKKHSQAALKKNKPAPAQLTIPDDYCHYSLEEPRVLTVREMARIQSFPDSFIFKSKVTTGGLNRRIEVPQYTQVGNAVPPLLAYEIGMFIQNLTSNGK